MPNYKRAYKITYDVKQIVWATGINEADHIALDFANEHNLFCGDESNAEWKIEEIEYSLSEVQDEKV